MKKSREMYCGGDLFLWHKVAGFTLTELLVAVVILAIAVLMAFHVFVTVTTQRTTAYNISVAANLAQDKLEEFKNAAYANIVSGAENNLDETGTAAADGIFDRAWVVNADVPIAGTKTITVTVTYPYLSGTQTVTLWTIRGQ